jgi:hypothetical protein
MADLKPIGSEKLTGQDKLKRIMEIARFNETIPQSVNETTQTKYAIPLADGNGYEIVKERQGYIIKKTISEGQNEYIEPMKNRKYYSSYSQAFKRLNLLASELNRLNENEEGVNLYGEQKKFVLKTPKSVDAEPETDAVPSAPPAVPAPELPPSPVAAEPPSDEVMPSSDDAGVEDMSVDAEMDVTEPPISPDQGVGEEVSYKTIQKLTGKLTQKIRDYDSKDGLTSEEIKYVVNMVLSAVDLKALTDEDKEDIMSKFEEDSEDLGLDDMGGEDLTDDSEVENIQADMDVPVPAEEGMGHHGSILDSIFSESKVDKVISKYFEISKKEIMESKAKKVMKMIEKKSIVNEMMKEVKKMSETVEQEMASQKFLEENFNFRFVGKTNKKNLVFENKKGQVKISPFGIVL